MKDIQIIIRSPKVLAVIFKIIIKQELIKKEFKENEKENPDIDAYLRALDSLR